MGINTNNVIVITRSLGDVQGIAVKYEGHVLVVINDNIDNLDAVKESLLLKISGRKEIVRL